MSDTDDLPPLPASDVVLYGDGYARETMQAYARAAIAAHEAAGRRNLDASESSGTVNPTQRDLIAYHLVELGSLLDLEINVVERKVVSCLLSR